ncbi:penicillin-binding protein 2 [Patescibacteria group bacterium]|nr:penicillin-binding protein 2 [Patescibacteria group bacterium]
MIKSNPFKIQEGSVKDSKVSGFIKQKKSGDYLELGWLGKHQRLGKFFADRKIRNLFILFLFILFILFGRAFYLQVVRGEYFRNVAEGNRIKSNIIKANRGLFYDRFGNLMVKNVSYFFLYLIPDFLPTEIEIRDEILNQVASTLGIDKTEIEARIQEESDSSDQVLIYENISYQTAIKLIIMSENYPAINISFEPRRQYFADLGSAHILGYLGAVGEEDVKDAKYNYHDRIGKSGLELIYEDVLRGKDGSQEVEVDALFREKNMLSITDPIDGDDLYLTLDNKAQAKLAEIMKKYAANYDKPKMAAIVLDPKDGGILAMNSLPDYDSNIFTSVLNTGQYQEIIQDENNPLLNRVISGTYPLGSVFKTVVASAALEEKVINKNFKVNSTGGVSVGGSFFPDWRAGGHGMTDIYWAIADSVNTFFYSIGGGNNEWLSRGLGVDKIIDYAKKFGFGNKTGVDLPSEAVGFLPSKDWKEDTFGERWYLGDTYNLSIGQGFLTVTPIQTAVMMSYFANQGVAYQPHFVKEIKQGDKIVPYEPKAILTNLVASDNLSTVREALRLTVTQGTAQSLQSVPVKVAGKTGTAQFRKDKIPHSWMAAFAPYDDPKIVTVVLVEEGGDVGWAVAITREFMEWYFSQ